MIKLKELETPFWAQEKWWGLFFAVVVPVLNYTFNWGLNPTELAAIFIPIIALLVGGIWKEIEVMKAKLQLLRENRMPHS